MQLLPAKARVLCCQCRQAVRRSKGGATQDFRGRNQLQCNHLRHAATISGDYSRRSRLKYDGC